jgi:hypothetical protein
VNVPRRGVEGVDVGGYVSNNVFFFVKIIGFHSLDESIPFTTYVEGRGYSN